jgi:hypothetical protein
MTALFDGKFSMICDSRNLDSCDIPGEQMMEIYLRSTCSQAQRLWEMLMNGLLYLIFLRNLELHGRALR